MGIFEHYVGFVGKWWMPYMIGMMSGINLFTLVLSAPTALLFCSTVIAQPQRWWQISVVNALGTMVGAAAIVVLIESKGTDYITSLNPDVFASSSWEETQNFMRDYGAVGTALVSALPVVLHPIILFAVLAKMEASIIIGAILIGRILKYCVMARIALVAPASLRFFGVDASKLFSEHKKNR